MIESAQLRCPVQIARKAVLAFVALLFAGNCFAAPQNTGAPAIRVESGEVMVPVMVFDKGGQRYVPGLTAHNFRVFDDGQEEKIQEVSNERVYLRDFRDNSGAEEREWAWTPGQMWSLLNGGPFPFPVAGPAFYVLSYAQPSATKSGCHKVTVRVARRNAIVRARTEYCSTAHAPSDPLNGTVFSKEMEKEAAGDRGGRIPLSVQAGFFYSDAKTPRIYVVVEYPTRSINYSAGRSLLAARLGILTDVHGIDGTLSARATDVDEEYFINQADENRVLGSHQIYAPDAASDVPTVTPNYSLEDAMRRAFMPNHHETQMKLAPGRYEIRVVLNSGTEFGRAELPLTVDAYDDKQLGISSIALCKQFNDPRESLDDTQHERGFWQSEKPLSTLSHFVFLISRGNAFTPAGDTRFKQGETLFAYYEVYEPLLVSAQTTQVYVRVRIFDNQTGDLKSDTGWQSTEKWVRPSNPVIAIAQQVNVSALKQGSYRIEVHASDSAGRETEWRNASFEVE